MGCEQISRALWISVSIALHLLPCRAGCLWLPAQPSQLSGEARIRHGHGGGGQEGGRPDASAQAQIVDQVVLIPQTCLRCCRGSCRPHPHICPRPSPAPDGACERRRYRMLTGWIRRARPHIWAWLPASPWRTSRSVGNGYRYRTLTRLDWVGSCVPGGPTPLHPDGDAGFQSPRLGLPAHDVMVLP